MIASACCMRRVPAAAMGRLSEVFRCCCKSGDTNLSLEEFVFASGFIVSVLENALDVKGPAAAGVLHKEAQEAAAASPRDGLIQILRTFRRHVFQQATQTPFF